MKKYDINPLKMEAEFTAFLLLDKNSNKQTTKKHINTVQTVKPVIKADIQILATKNTTKSSLYKLFQLTKNKGHLKAV